MFKRTSAINKLLKLNNRKKIVQGGTFAGKTYSIIPILINRALKTGRLKITVVAETLPAVKDGALDIFFNIMNDTNRWIQKGWNGSNYTYTFGNGSRIQFKSFDSVGKAKASGKRDILFLNEANHISYEIAYTLMIRSTETWIDFNADKEFWAHTELLKEPKVDFIELTYLDNESCPEETIEDLNIKIEKAKTSEYWRNWCNVYVYGKIGYAQGVVFNNYELIDTIPSDARLLGCGLDFGFSNDFTAVVEVYKWNAKRILNEIVYQKGLYPNELAKLLKGKPIIYADPSASLMIAELKRLGINITAASGHGAEIKKINYGIAIIQENEYLVTKNSLNLIKELRNYSWAKDKNGTSLNKPIDAYNHAIDGFRYHEIMTLGILKRQGSDFRIL